jgi:predicted phosphate transport protein (TIGR00153 family)
VRWSILPREEKFFDLFQQLADKTVEAALALRDLLVDYTDIHNKAKRIKDLEHEADLITHELLDKLNKSFITPIDREDIRELAQYLDDVIDAIEDLADIFPRYGIERPTQAAVEMVTIICRATEQIQGAIKTLENLKSIHVFLVEINRLENMADNISRNEIGKLFREEQDLRQVLRWKDVYEQFEGCADRCEDVANIIEDIVVKSA